MKLKSSLSFALYEIFGQVNFLNNTVRLFYLNISIPLFASFLKLRHRNIIKVLPRNSIYEREHFNAILSDIDLTVVIQDNTDTVQIIKTFLLLKKFLKMFDMPEVYYKSEHERIDFIKNHTNWNILNTFWHIRKINWNLKSLRSVKTKIHNLKLERSIKKSFYLITGKPVIRNTIYLNDLIHLKSFALAVPNGTVCSYSPFLETDKETSLKILLDRKEYANFNYLMPDQKLWIGHENLKKLIMEYEIYITLASLRIDEARNITSNEKLQWAKVLRDQIGK